VQSLTAKLAEVTVKHAFLDLNASVKTDEAVQVSATIPKSPSIARRGTRTRSDQRAPAGTQQANVGSMDVAIEHNVSARPRNSGEHLLAALCNVAAARILRPYNLVMDQKDSVLEVVARLQELFGKSGLCRVKFPAVIRESVCAVQSDETQTRVPEGYVKRRLDRLAVTRQRHEEPSDRKPPRIDVVISRDDDDLSGERRKKRLCRFPLARPRTLREVSPNYRNLHACGVCVVDQRSNNPRIRNSPEVHV
jgi:hypothetical protein